jgi:diphthine synthase
MIATTHQELRTRAAERGIATRIHHNASVATAVPGALGLHSYKFGKAVTITQSGGSPPTTAYHAIRRNLQQGLHTMVLLEYGQANGFALGPERALRALLRAEREHRQGALERTTPVVVASRLGWPTERIEGGGLADVARRKFGRPPHCIVIPGLLHFTEQAALRVLFGIDAAQRPKVLRPAERLVPRYLAKSRRALARARRRAAQAGQRQFATLFENVEAYLSDAERFLGEGHDELAMLSTGYAEGLLDALNYTHQLPIEW